MAENKTKPEKENVVDFINKIRDEEKRKDSFVILELMKKITKENPVMWGSSIIGFGNYHYKFASGREGDWPIVAFSPRKQSISFYLTCFKIESFELLKKLGKHKIGVSCLYVNKLKDIDMKILKQLIEFSIDQTKEIFNLK